MKKAQIHGQVIVYILAVVIIAMVLFFGYRAVTNFIDQSEDVAFIQFRSELTGAIQSVAQDYNTVRIRDFTVPGGTTEVCFIKRSADASGLLAINGADSHPLIYDSWNNPDGNNPDDKTNVFIVKDLAEGFIFAGNEDTGQSYVDVTNDEHYVCISAITGKVKVRMEGKGDRAIISDPRAVVPTTTTTTPLPDP